MGWREINNDIIILNMTLYPQAETAEEAFEMYMDYLDEEFERKMNEEYDETHTPTYDEVICILCQNYLDECDC